VIFPSIVEGFGLPIVEALWFGQKTFASDTKIHREVGQSDCTYFGLDDPQHLVGQIEQWEQAKAAGARPPASGRRLTSWRQSTEQVLDFCGLLLNQPQENRTAA
jgi:alpha-1,2-rhamnosyltransferase